MLTLTKNSLPLAVASLAKSPKRLYVICKNWEELLKRPALAVVGSRKITPYGRGVTQALAGTLAGKGVVIVSGLALGADSVAHQAALDSGGQTIAVLPCGADKVYPSSHTDLARRIVETGGALITEYEAETEPFPSNFLERNRLIAALSDGVLITEAAARSGSLNTASHALELGKPVFAVPGNITSPLSEGCNNLIKAGAIPVTRYEDIVNALGWQPDRADNKDVTAHNEAEKVIIDLLKEGVADGSALQLASKLTPDVFNQTLTMLELTGRVRATGANHWSL